jgi:WD40 repeat protein
MIEFIASTFATSSCLESLPNVAVALYSPLPSPSSPSQSQQLQSNPNYPPKITEVIPFPHSHTAVTALAFGPRRNSRFLYICGSDETIHIWDRKEQAYCALSFNVSAILKLHYSL